MRTILVIAGSDSSGGAGIEADQKVIAAHGCYAMTATTALTVQNTQGVYGIHITPSDFVRRQIQACMDDIGADAVKIGMLASAETVEAVANTFHQYGISNSVVDPVMVSTSGSQLLHEDAVRSLRERLLPKTMLLTPNIPEARLLLQNAGKSVKEPESVDDMIDLAKSIEELGPTYVLLKGGHMPFNTDESVEGAEGKRYVADILVGPHGTTVMKTDFLESKNTHGTGCSLASAIASNLARGVDIIRAVKLACQFVEAGIKTSVQMGRGHGPINHFHSTYSLPFA
ncbi:MAG: hypothetical protein M1825_004928 [Sarcosagium campestre]|nr:MAG: hypothetical protein M1825_004928 [Sarcosagium campestre]